MLYKTDKLSENPGLMLGHSGDAGCFPITTKNYQRACAGCTNQGTGSISFTAVQAQSYRDPYRFSWPIYPKTDALAVGHPGNIISWLY